jgi:hypothetical protein
MTGSEFLVLQAAVQRGPWVAAAAALTVTPFGYAVIAACLERRVLRARSEFTALLYGDPLLAIAVGIGAWLLGGRKPATVASPPFSIASSLFWLAFGLLQWRAEVCSGFYTFGQAVAPTKIWHQLVVYPVLGYWMWAACVGGMLAPGTAASPILSLAARTGLMGCVGAWLLALAYDRRHAKLGHPPYDWHTLSPLPMPWPSQSASIRAYLARR